MRDVGRLTVRCGAKYIAGKTIDKVSKTNHIGVSVAMGSCVFHDLFDTWWPKDGWPWPFNPFD